MFAKRFYFQICLLLIGIAAPLFLHATETVQTDRVQATILDSGNWELTDFKTGLTWNGQWITPQLMKVTGSDKSCFVIGENQSGMIQLDCKNLKEISILLSY